MTPEVKERIDQIRNGNVPEGYKKTRKGTIPNQWQVRQIRDVATISSGSTPNRENPQYWGGDIPWVTTGELESGMVTSTREMISQKALEETSLKIYPAGTLLMAMYGQGKTRGTTAMLGIDAAINQACAAITVEEGSKKYLFYLLQDAYTDIRKLSNTGNQENLNAEIIRTFPIIYAPINEQQQIADILSEQDRLIKLKEKLLAEKQQQKKYLMQQLLTGKKRLPGFDGEWQNCRLHQIVKRIRRKNTVGNENVLTISAQYGLINQSEFFNKEIASEDKSNYYLLNRNDFAYNKSYSSGYPFGAIKRLTRYDMGIVSPLYICFEIVGENVSLEYMEQYFEAGLMNREIQAFAQEGARNHGLLNIAVDDFFNSKLVLPSIEEQQAIAEILSVADREIELLRQDLEQEKQKKKALMQLLLTGIVRVNA